MVGILWYLWGFNIYSLQLVRYITLVIVIKCIYTSLLKGAQTIGMGVEAQKVPAAIELYKRANNILGYIQHYAIIFCPF